MSAAAAGTIAGYISTDQYTWGLRKVLDGIAAVLPVGAGTLKPLAG